MSSFGNSDGLGGGDPTGRRIAGETRIQAPLLEVCAASVASAQAALEGGADRIEFCRELRVGGLTPDFREIEQLAEAYPLPVHVLVRPRAGDFMYDAEEFRNLLGEVRMCRDLGVAGIVTGCLTVSGEPDLDRMRRVMDAAGGLPVTFHRAFDLVTDPFRAMDRLVELGVGRILTSGGQPDAVAGAAALRRWIDWVDGRLEIMPGGGIRVENLSGLHRVVGARSYHASLQKRVEPGPAGSAAAEGETDAGLVRLAVKILRAV